MTKRGTACVIVLILVFGVLSMGEVFAQSPTPLPEIHLSTSSHDYGLVKVGYSQDWVLRVANRGLGRLTIFDITSDHPDFQISDPVSFPQYVNYSGGRTPDSLFVTVTFTPSTVGEITGRLTVLSNDADEGTLYVSLEGQGTAPDINIFEVIHDFNGVVVGSALDWTLVVHNTGPVDLVLTEITSSNPNFIVVVPNHFPESIPPGGRIDVVISFAPISGGVKTGNLIIRSDDPDESVYYVSLLGEGLAADIDVSTMAYDFGELMSGTSSSWELTVYNRGTLDLIISQAIISPPIFSVVSPLFPQTVEPNGSLTVEIVVSPEAVGDIDGTLTLRSNDPDESELIVSLTGTVIPRSPDIVLSAVSHNFGDVLLSSSVTWDFQIQNTGLIDLTVNSILSDQAEFSILTPSFPQQVAPDESLNVTVAFTPTAVGARSGILTVRSDDPDQGVLTLSIFGRGVAPKVEVSARSYDFGNVLVGSSSAWNVTLSNVGTADLVIESVVSSHSNFLVADAQFPRTIPPGGSIIQTVLFTPSSLGLIAGNLTVNTNDPDESVLLIALNGIGVKPDIYVSADSHDFGDVHLGSSGYWDLGIQNLGTAPLTVTGLFSSASSFTVSAPSFPQTVDPGEILSVTVVFTPASLGEITGNLTIISNDPEQETLVVQVRGTGSAPPAPRIHISENTHDFDLVNLGASTEWRVTVYNRGDLDLIVSSASSDNPDFQVISPPVFPNSIDPLSHMHITIAFAPSGAGTRTGHITIGSNDPDRALVSLAVAGYGSAPEIELSSLSHDYGKVLLLNPEPWTMRVTNQGSKDLLVTEITSDQEEFIIASAGFPRTLPPGTNLDVVVTFLPQVEGERRGTVTVFSNDPNEPLLTVPVVGVGASSKIHVSEFDHDFGLTAVGDTSLWTIIVTNVGEEDLVVDNITSSHPDFIVLSPRFPQRITYYCGIEVTLAFVPSSDGQKRGHLSVNNNDSFQPCAPLELVGIGIAPDIAFSTLSQNFGDVLLGQSRSGRFRISNVGTIDLVVDSIVSNHTDFSITSPAFPQVIGPGGEIEVTTRFAPTALGERTGHFTAYSDDYDEAQQLIDVRGRGVSPEIELSAWSHDFGQIWAGDCTLWSFTITNQGSFDLLISDIACALPEYAIVGVTFPQKIYPRCELEVPISFCPQAVGVVGCDLVIETNHPDVGDVTIQLMGEGVLPEIAASALEHNFGGLSLGESADWVLTVSNSGTAQLTVASIVLTNTVDFAIPEYTFPVLLDPQGSLDVPIVFEPQTSTHKESDLIITSDDPFNPVVSVHLRGKGLVKDILLSDKSHDFGSVAVGQRSDWSFTITNLGQLPLDITEVIPSLSDFRVTAPLFPHTIEGGRNVEVTVSFVPTDIGIRSGTLEIQSTDPDEGSMIVTLVGVGFAPDIGLSAYNYDFGQVLVGECVQWPMRVNNTGTFDLEVSSITLNHPDFNVQGPTLPFSIGPGNSQELIVTYCPSAAETEECSLSMCVDGLLDRCVSVDLRGTGIVPDIAFSAPSHNYGPVYVGGTSNWVLMILNVGTADLTVSGVVSEGGAFVVTAPTFPRTIPPEGSVGVVVAFTPEEVGAVSGNLVVSSDDPNESEVTIPLEGSGVLPQFIVSDTFHDFGNVITGDSATWSFTVSNAGGARMTISAIASDNADFSITGPAFPRTLEPDGTVDVGVLFAPRSSGEKSGILSITTDDPSAPVFAIELTGKAVVTGFQLSENQHDYGKVLVGQTSAWTMILSNGGRTELMVLSIGSDLPEYVVISDEFPLAIAPQESIEVGVDFTPWVMGIFDGTLTIEILDFGDDPPTVQLTGEGVQQDIEVLELSHDYGNVVVGDSSSWFLTINNAGTADLIIDTIYTDHDDFQVDGLTFPIVLPADRLPPVPDIPVTFKPSSAVAAEGHLTILSDDPDEGEIVVTLTGYGVDANVYASDSYHDFGDVQLRGSEEWTFRLYNIGKSDLRVEHVLSGCEAFTVTDPEFPQTLGSGTQLDITVTFTPLTTDLVTCTLNVLTDDPDEGVLNVVVTGRGVGRGIAVTVRGIGFGPVRIGSSVVRTLTVYNNGLLEATVDDILSTHTDFQIVAPLFPYTIGPQDSVDVTIAFTPSEPGLAEGSLNIGSNDPDQPLLSVTVHGQGITPEINLSAEHHDFGKINVGSFSNWVFMIQNRGTADLAVSSVLSDNPQLTVVSPNFPRTIPTDDSCGVVVRFAPVDMGPASGTVTIISDDLDESTLTVALRGEGVLPDIALSALHHDYGEVEAGDTSLWVLTVSNVGSANLVVESMFSDHSDFAVLSPSFPQVIEPEAHVMVTVAFRPTSGQERSGRLSVYSDDPDESVLEVGLTGRGIASDVHVDVRDHDFGGVVVGDSTSWMLPLRNIGRASLTVHSVNTEGKDFNVVSPIFPQTVAPGQHLDVSIQFQPSDLGPIEGTVTVLSSDLSEPTVIIPVRGEGFIEPVLQIVDGFGDPGSAGNKVSVHLYTPLDISALEFGLTYDSQVLTITDAQLGADASHMGIFDIDFPLANRVFIHIGDADGGVISPRSGTVTEFTFQVAAEAPMGQLPLVLTDVVLYEGDGTPVPVVPQDGVFTVTLPDIVVPHRVYDYGDVSVNRPEDWPCPMWNSGTKDLIISGITVDHIDFYTIEPSFPCTLAVAESSLVIFRFAPSAIGPISASAIVESNDPDEGAVTISLGGVGIKPDICMGEIIHDFGDVLAGTSFTWPALIANLGKGALTVDSIFTVGSDFSVEALTYPFVVMESESIFVGVTFTPALAGAIRGSLVVVSNDPDEERFVLPLWGRGVAPDIDLSAVSHDFGEVDVGQIADEDFLIYNRGTAELTIDSLKAQPDAFTFFGPDFPETVAPGDSFALSVSFAPTFMGEISGDLTLFSDDPDEGEFMVFLSGVGAAPKIESSATSYIFGRVKLGESETWEFLISNVGTRDLIIESVEPDTSDYAVTVEEEFPLILEPGEDIVVGVIFQPSAVGMISGRLIIRSNDPEQASLHVTLLGHGAEPDIDLSATLLDFMSVALGNASERTLTVRNIGEADLVLTDIHTDNGDFTVSGLTLPVTVEKRDSMTVTVTFTPTTVGAIQGSLIVASDDPDEPLISVDLLGEGVPPARLTLGNGHGTPESEDNPVFLFLDNTVPVASVELLVNFDPDVLSLNTVHTTERLGQMSHFEWDEGEVDGTIHVLISDVSDHIIEPGTGSIIRLGFDVTADAEFGTTPLTLSDVTLYGAFDSEVLTGTEDGFFTVGTSYVYNFGDVPLGQKSSITLNYSFPDQDCDWIVGKIECNNPDFTIESPCSCPLVVSSSLLGQLELTIGFSPSQMEEEWGLITLRLIAPHEQTILLPIVGRGVTAVSENWAVDVVCLSSDVTLEEDERRKELTFGVDSAGSDGLDGGLDVALPPPSPGGEDFSAYFPLELEFGTLRLQRDIRSSARKNIEWTIETEGTGGTMSWDPSALPEGEFTLNGSVDMKSIGEVFFVANETVTIQYASPQSAIQLQSLSVQFGDGWATVLWETAYEENVAGYNLYRVGEAGVRPSAEHRLNTSIITGSHAYSFVDKTADPGEIYYYWVEVVGFDGSTMFLGSVSGRVAVPKNFVLSQNYPNPFNPETHIDFTLHSRENVSLVIYNALGQQIRALVQGPQSPGTYTITWDGCDDDGVLVPSGMFFYRITVGTISETKKMVMLK
ncbi:MAG: choice-of-anchor D domain-containing protein [Gemmatimonadota bacterium]|nr:MAG: choice-of-anchor D domain-containing protein [Gemmatimonadota bacterium]